MKKFSIIEFTEENAVEIIPSSWLSSDKKTTLWPPIVTPSLLKKYLTNNTEPGTNWNLVKIRVLGDAGTDFLHIYTFIFTYLSYFNLFIITLLYLILKLFYYHNIQL